MRMARQQARKLLRCKQDQWQARSAAAAAAAAAAVAAAAATHAHAQSNTSSLGQQQRTVISRTARSADAAGSQAVRTRSASTESHTSCGKLMGIAEVAGVEL